MTHVLWSTYTRAGDKVVVDQDRQVDELSEVNIPKNLSDETKCTPEMHISFRSLLGSLNWLQSRTQFHVAYRFSRVQRQDPLWETYAS